MISVIIRQTTVTMLTPPQLQGRVSAVEWVFISASNELGAFESGAVASLVGAVPAVVGGGIAIIGIAAIWPKVFPALSRLGRLADFAGAWHRLAGAWHRLSCRVDRAWSRSTASTIWPYDERGEPGDFYYSRYASPTVADAEAGLGELDGGEAVLFPSGSGATTALVLSLLGPATRSRSRRARTSAPASPFRRSPNGACTTSSSTRPVRRPTACSSSGSRRRRTRS